MQPLELIQRVSDRRTGTPGTEPTKGMCAGSTSYIQRDVALYLNKSPPMLWIGSTLLKDMSLSNLLTVAPCFEPRGMFDVL